jgi:DNA-binding IclR family transcriptional regulator
MPVKRPQRGDAPHGAQAVWRALAILGVFTDDRPSWSLADLARAQRLSKPTALRILSALERAGFVARPGPAGAYRLGTAAIELGARAQRVTSVSAVARVELEALARETGETSSLEILHRGETLILDEVHGQHLIGTAPSIGMRWPAHATSTGKILLAAARERTLEPSQASQTTADGATLRRLTGRTITNRSALEAELDRVNEQGHASVVGELEPDFVAMAAPVHNHLGQVVAAISVGGPVSRLRAEARQRITRLVVQAAGRVSERLGYLRR